MSLTIDEVNKLRIALVYDRVNKWGGAERVLLALHDLFPNAPLYTSVYSSKNAPWASVFQVNTSFLQNFPHIVSHHELYPFLMPIAFESFSFENFDLVISITSEAAKGIVTKPSTKHICFCLTPTRYLWSGHEEYFQNKLLKTVARPAVSYLRAWDKTASTRPDIFVAISDEVKKRIKAYYAIDSAVIYPPVTAVKQKNELLNSTHTKSKHSYFLVVSRLSRFTAYKRIDLAIEACTELNIPLKIIGTGNLQKKLRKIAGKNVEFLGSVTDSELAGYYAHSQGLIFPGFEDLGLTMIEAQLYGTPVIAYKKGGALETVIDGKTGIFFDKQTKESLKQALKSFKTMRFNKKALIAQARKYSKESFQKDFLTIVRNIF